MVQSFLLLSETQTSTNTEAIFTTRTLIVVMQPNNNSLRLELELKLMKKNLVAGKENDIDTRGGPRQNISNALPSQ